MTEFKLMREAHVELNADHFESFYRLLFETIKRQTEGCQRQ